MKAAEKKIVDDKKKSNELMKEKTNAILEFQVKVSELEKKIVDDKKKSDELTKEKTNAILEFQVKVSELEPRVRQLEAKVHSLEADCAQQETLFQEKAKELKIVKGQCVDRVREAVDKAVEASNIEWSVKMEKERAIQKKRMDALSR